MEFTSSAALADTPFLEGFIMESMRIYCFQSTAVHCTALRPLTFSDGNTLCSSINRSSLWMVISIISLTCSTRGGIKGADARGQMSLWNGRFGGRASLPGTSLAHTV